NFDQFELTAHINPHFFQMNFIDGQLDIMPIENSTAQRERRIITQAGNWCNVNSNLIGSSISSQGYFTLLNGDILGPTFAVVLTARWNTLTNAQQNEEYLPVAPNFVIKLCSQSDSPQYVHNKMLRWINSGVEVCRQTRKSISL
ncbi:10854_t:CDS:2, partial [Rhizophagus irregularis]